MKYKLHFHILICMLSSISCVSGMFNHTDQLPVGSYQLQLTGRKIWTVCLPSSTASSFQTSAPTPTPTCFIYTLQPGEAIYYPPYAHHATQCIEGPCTSISGSVVVDEYSLKRFVYTECNEKRRGYQFSNVICRRMWD
ncbi:hypothetical protein EON65_49500 [archaeon]|nr:MAG: hypothetical protein EON65_49500 [archaeon]